MLAAIVTAVVVPYIKSKTTIIQQTRIHECVRIAVSAAEQVYTGSERGKEKKAFVVDWIREHDITVDEMKLDTIIEAAVYELNNGFITISGTVTKSEGAYDIG